MDFESIYKYKTAYFRLKEGFRFTGREMATQLLISKNKDAEGKNVTLIISKKQGRYFFQPITDIYLDFNNTELIIPQYHPVYIVSDLYRDIILSSKYKNHYVFAPDSDFQTFLKEVEGPDGNRFWILTFNEIHLYLYRYNILSCENEDDSEHSAYLSKHQICTIEEREAKEEAQRQNEWNRECQRMTDDLFEEAGYDFLD